MKSLVIKLKTQLTTTKMWTSSYKFNISLTFDLNFSCVKSLRYLAALILLSPTCLFFFMITSLFALIIVLWSSLLIVISYAMVAKLLDYDCNTFAFVYALPFEVDAKLRLEINDGIYVRSFINPHIVRGVEA